MGSNRRHDGHDCWLCTVILAWGLHRLEQEGNGTGSREGRQSKPEIIGRIVEAHVRMHGRSTEKGLSTPSCLLVLKFSVTNRTAVDSTLRDASLLVQTNGQEYISQRIELGMGDFYQTAYNSIPRRMNDLIVSTTYSTPIRKAVASDGWLEFLVDGLNAAENNAVRADLIVTLTDELGSEHIIKADNVTINR